MLYGGSSGNIGPYQGNAAEKILDVVLEMNADLWLPFPNATSFYIVERDQNGNPVRFYGSHDYDIWNGLIRFSRYFGDKNGEIVVRLPDGTEVAYGLSNHGRRIIPTTVLLKAGKVSALGTRTFRGINSTVIVEVSPEEFARNINPLLQLVVTGEKPSLIQLAAWWRDSSGHKRYASTVRVWSYGQPSSSGMDYKIDPSANYMNDIFPPGPYWVKFGFDGWPVGNQFYPPYDGNGTVGTVSSGGGGKGP
jgi:hypothetical protein